MGRRGELIQVSSESNLETKPIRKREEDAEETDLSKGSNKGSRVEAPNSNPDGN